MKTYFKKLSYKLIDLNNIDEQNQDSSIKKKKHRHTLNIRLSYWFIKELIIFSIFEIKQ